MINDLKGLNLLLTEYDDLSRKPKQSKEERTRVHICRPRSLRSVPERRWPKLTSNSTTNAHALPACRKLISQSKPTPTLKHAAGNLLFAVRSATWWKALRC